MHQAMEQFGPMDSLSITYSMLNQLRYHLLPKKGTRYATLILTNPTNVKSIKIIRLELIGSCGKFINRFTVSIPARTPSRPEDVNVNHALKNCIKLKQFAILKSTYVNIGSTAITNNAIEDMALKNVAMRNICSLTVLSAENCRT
jgi:hypothetical protein